MAQKKSQARSDGSQRTSAEVDRLTGTLTHQVVQTVLTKTWPRHLEQDLPLLVISEAVAAVKSSPTPGNQQRRTILRVASGASSYLVRYCPPAPVEFLGAEYPLEDGRLDLLWQCSDGLVIFDELKTSRHAGISQADRAQVSEYALAGHRRFGAQFAGVRYLPLKQPQGAQLFTTDGRSVTERPLSDSPFSWGLAAVVGAR